MTGVRRPSHHIVVVGGGIAGLAAAHEASQDPDVRVTVLEATPRFGGRIATTGIELPDGTSITVDEGADAFLARVPDAIELCDELGLSGELTEPAARTAMVVIDGAMRPLPTGTVLGVPVDFDAVAAAGVLSPEGLARAAQELDRDDPAPGRDVAIGPFLRDRFGDEVVDRLVGPLIGGINAGDIETMSLEAVTPQLAAAAAEGGSLAAALARRQGSVDPDAAVFRTPLGGVQRLVDALVERLRDRGVQLVTGTAVTAITHLPPDGADGVALAEDARVAGDVDPVGPVEGVGDEGVATSGLAVTHRGSGDAESATLHASGVVLATPARVAAPLLGDLSPNAADAAGAIRHSSVVLVTFVFTADSVDTPSGISGVLVPRDADLLMTAASFGSEKWSHWDDGRHVVLRVSAGRDGDDRASALEDQALADALLGDLRTVAGITAEPVAIRVSRYPSGFAQYDVGHLDTVAAARAALSRDAPRVVVAGSGYDGVGIPASIRSGRTAARQVLSSLPRPTG